MQLPNIRHLFLACLLITFPLSAFAQTTELSPGHSVNLESDVVLGSADAPNEMIMYYSPGCWSCLEYLSSHITELRDQYVEPGELRVVFRQVPDIFRDRGSFGETANQESRDRSHALALHLRCRYAEGGIDSYLSTVNQMTDAIRQSHDQPPLLSWPYLEGDTRQRFGEIISANGGFDIEEFQTCQQSTLGAQETAYIEQLGRFFVGNGWRVVPAVFLNGEHIPETGFIYHSRALDALISGDNQ